jgi:hypothetical protein
MRTLADEIHAAAIKLDGFLRLLNHDLGRLEASPGIEPGYKDLQASVVNCFLTEK